MKSRQKQHQHCKASKVVKRKAAQLFASRKKFANETWSFANVLLSLYVYSTPVAVTPASGHMTADQDE